METKLCCIIAAEHTVYGTVAYFFFGVVLKANIKRFPGTDSLISLAKT